MTYSCEKKKKQKKLHLTVIFFQELTKLVPNMRISYRRWIPGWNNSGTTLIFNSRVWNLAPQDKLLTLRDRLPQLWTLGQSTIGRVYTDFSRYTHIYVYNHIMLSYSIDMYFVHMHPHQINTQISGLDTMDWTGYDL